MVETLSFPLTGKGAERKGERERTGSPEGLLSGAGLGRREAQWTQNEGRKLSREPGRGRGG